MVGSVRKGSPSVTVGDLRRDELELISWSGSPSHIKNVAAQLDRRDLGLVEYLVVRDGLDPSRATFDRCRASQLSGDGPSVGRGARNASPGLVWMSTLRS